MADLGHASVASSGGISDLARCQFGHSERDTNRVMVKKYNLSLPVERSYLETKGAVGIPVLKMTSWARFLLKHNCWHVLTGLLAPDDRREKAILKAFWAKFQEQCPEHDIFRMAQSNELSLESTAPVCIHGDEGRGQKHKAYLVVSFRSLLGRGLVPSEIDKCRRGVKKPFLKQRCNYKGHSFTSRFMIAGLNKSAYTGDNSPVFESLMSHCATEARSLATTGVVDANGQTKWMQLLFITGDWPWLHKSGKFSRSFNNVQKRLAQQVAKGICHQCNAGMAGIPFEQVSTRRPVWLSTEFMDEPFTCESPFRVVPHDRSRFASMWAFDFFHTWHLGVAKVFIGGALALLSTVQSEGNVDERMATVSAIYKNWCVTNKRRACIEKLTKESINWSTTRCFPVGAWHKGELSTVLMRFVEDYLCANPFPQEPMLELVRQAAIAINASIRAMYRSDLWLSRDECHEVAGNGLRFLRRFLELAHQGELRSMNLFSFTPKIHVLQKIFLRVHFAQVANTSQLNPLAVSVQQCEDFIGRPSRLSRRVTGGRLASDRVMDRYLQSCYHHWIEAGYLIRP